MALGVLKSLMHIIEKIILECDRAIVAEDFDALLGHYTDDAVLVIQPGMNATGKQEIRTAFQKIAVYFKHGLKVTQDGMEILQTGDTALVLAKTIIEAPNQSTEQRMATYVFTKDDDRWLCSIDNSYGHQILGVDG